MIEDPDPYADLKQHRMTPETQALIERRAARVPKRLQKRQQHFVKVPWSWVERLQGVRRPHLPGSPLCCCIYIGRVMGGPIKLPTECSSLMASAASRSGERWPTWNGEA